MFIRSNINPLVVDMQVPLSSCLENARLYAPGPPADLEGGDMSTQATLRIENLGLVESAPFDIGVGYRFSG